MKHILTLFCLFIGFNTFSQQVPRTVIVEHFTNTYCGICANKNPDLYTNLDSNPDILHVAYHPSVPYAQCPFNQHNKTENDERTVYYGLLTGTPRIVIQGEIGSTNFSSSTLFDAYKGQTSSFSIENTLDQDVSKENLILKVKITKEDASSLTQLNLYAMIVEETLNFNAQNGETVHHDVFRKSFVGQDPISVTLPTNVGENVEYEYQIPYNSVWDGTELKAISILQHDDKEVEQSAETTTLDDFIAPVLSVELDTNMPLHVYPSVFSDRISFTYNSSDSLFDVSLFDITGRLLFNKNLPEGEINFSSLNLKNSQYILVVKDKENVFSKKITKVD